MPPPHMRWLADRPSRKFVKSLAAIGIPVGLLIVALLIVRSVREDAEYKQIKQSFIDTWALAYDHYIQRLGAPVGDSPVAPLLMVAGIDYIKEPNSAAPPSPAGQNGPGAICNGAAPVMSTPAISIAATTGTMLREMMRGAAIKLPQGEGEGREDRYRYALHTETPAELQICFQWNPAGTASGSGNVMVISGLTPGLAHSLDEMIDGTSDPNSGAFRQAGSMSPGMIDGKHDWAASNVHSDNEGADSLLVAHYKMTQ